METPMHDQLKQIDTKEFELPDTVFIRDIESRGQESPFSKLFRIVAEAAAYLEGGLPGAGNRFKQIRIRPKRRPGNNTGASLSLTV